MSQNLTTYTIDQMPNITGPNLLYIKVMAKLASNSFYRSAKPFTLAKFLSTQMCRLSILCRDRKLKSLPLKQLLFKWCRQICSVGKQHSAIISGQFRKHFNIMNIGRGQFKCLNHPQRIDFGVQSKSVKSLVANLFSIGGKTFEEPAKSGSGKSTGWYGKAIDYLDSIFEFVCNVLKKTLFDFPQISSMSGEADSARKVGKVVAVEIPEESEDVFISVKTEDFADYFHCKYLAISHLRHRPSGSERSVGKEIFHKIISFTEDIYDKSIKIHFLALHGKWNSFCFLTYLFHRPEGFFNINTTEETCTRR
jgi:hypothetical protein